MSRPHRVDTRDDGRAPWEVWASRDSKELAMQSAQRLLADAREAGEGRYQARLVSESGRVTMVKLSKAAAAARRTSIPRRHQETARVLHRTSRRPGTPRVQSVEVGPAAVLHSHTPALPHSSTPPLPHSSQGELFA